jgi:hypothetical protein
VGTGPDRHVNHAGRVPSNSQGVKKSATYEDRYLVCLANLMNQMKLPAAAYSAEVATLATKAGSCGVCGEGESTRYTKYTRLTSLASLTRLSCSGVFLLYHSTELVAGNLPAIDALLPLV